MNNDLKQLRNMVGAHDPARQVRADPMVMSTALKKIIDDTGRTPQATTRRRSRRRWLIAVPIAAALTGAALALNVVVQPSEIGPLQVGPAKALAFSENGDHLDVRILDPDADPTRYRTDFAAYGMDVNLKMEPASPSLVGKMISIYSLKGMTIHHAGRSFEIKDENGSTMIEGIDGGPDCGNMFCKAGVRIPADLRSPIEIIFGRAARPGERYELAGDPTAPGEVLEGLTLRNRTVAEVGLLLRQRHTTVQEYYHDAPESPPGAGRGRQPSEHVLQPESVPGTWYVHEAFGGHDRNTVRLLVAPWPTSVRPYKGP
ncbi:hypothetical protein [Streptosporangium sp. NBC_01756]|uniref:hypothetical protein n=1 Tax=Streptosporangium sp. NBC_01756 TaxID=2975950 RepID=UPI002DD86E2E|nr:hypothetical protein [Streptosporangium sp. NBC_01756]WSC83444.1 hypothetical protein OIE48_23865 [Streptosporangium sp. NBC_01756]